MRIVYDTRRDIVVLLYSNRNSTPETETWEFDGTDWTQKTTGGPPGRTDWDMAFDERRGVTVMFGSGPSVWEWDGRSWFEHFGVPGPSPRRYPSLAWHPIRQRIVLRGGFDNTGHIQETWEWDGGTWTQLSEPPRSRLRSDQKQLAYLPGTGQMILVGIPTTGQAEQTWALTYNNPVTGSYTPFGTACAGSAGTPTLRPVGGDLPYINETFDLEVTGVPTGIFNAHFGVVGFSNTTWAGTPLPADLSAFGFQGCTGYVSVDLVFPLSGSGGVVPWTLSIPNDVNLGGLPFYAQVLTLDPGVSRRGTVTDAGAGVIGLR